MYIFLFWPFRVLGFFLTLYFLIQLGEKINIDGLGAIGIIVSAFSIPLLALFWIEFPKIYLKLFDHELKAPKKKKKSSIKKVQNNPLVGFFKGIGDLFNFFFGWAVPFVIFFILITLLASIS